MRNTQEINDFDYKKMIKDLEVAQRHSDYIKKIKKKWEGESKKYRETISHMKEFREESYLKKNQTLSNKLNKKEKLLITSLETKQKDKMHEKEKAIALMMEKEKTARENVGKYMEEQEKIRQLFQKEMQEKRKKNYIYNNFS